MCRSVKFRGLSHENDRLSAQILRQIVAPPDQLAGTERFRAYFTMRAWPYRPTWEFALGPVAVLIAQMVSPRRNWG